MQQGVHGQHQTSPCVQHLQQTLDTNRSRSLSVHKNLLECFRPLHTLLGSGTQTLWLSKQQNHSPSNCWNNCSTPYSTTHCLERNKKTYRQQGPLLGHSLGRTVFNSLNGSTQLRNFRGVRILTRTSPCSNTMCKLGSSRNDTFIVQLGVNTVQLCQQTFNCLVVLESWSMCSLFLVFFPPPTLHVISLSDACFWFFAETITFKFICIICVMSLVFCATDMKKVEFHHPPFGPPPLGAPTPSGPTPLFSGPPVETIQLAQNGLA